MEADNPHNTATGGGGESETKCVIPNVKVDEMEESAAKTKCNPVNEPAEAQHSEKNDGSTGEESEIKSVPPAANEKVVPELTLVLIGDTNSIEIGSKNILLDHDEPVNKEQFAFKLYDLCGRHISVINMLGLQNINKFPLNQGIHAFLLLLSNGLHNSHYSAGVQWLEKSFGKESLAYLMTVVTHESDETCESALTDLKANSSFDEKRYHTCTRSMMDEKEIINLLEKIDVMVSENDPHSKLMCGENKEQKEHLDHKPHEEEMIDSSVLQQNPTEEELEEEAAEIKVKSDPVKEPGAVEHSEKKDDDTGGESEIKFAPSATKDELEESATKSEVKCDPVNDDKHSDKNDDSRTVGGESEIESVIPSATNEKGEADEVKKVNDETCSNMNERPMEENDAVKDTRPISQTVSTVTKEQEELEEEAAEIKVKSDPVKEPGAVEHSEKKDDDTGGESEIKFAPSATKDELEESATKSEVKCDPVNDDKHSDKNDDSRTVGGESEIESVIPSATNEKGEADEVKKVNDETCSNMNERPMEENDAVKDTRPISQTVSTVTKEQEELEEEAAEIKVKSDPVKEPGAVEHSEKKDDDTGGESEIKFAPSATKDELEESATKSEVKCDPVNDDKHSDKNDDNRTVGGESEIESVIPSATNEKGEADEVKKVNDESSSNMNERPMEESDAVKDTRPTSQTVSTVIKEGTLDLDMSGNENKQSVKVSEEINRRKQYETVLGRLHLKDKHRQKFSTAEFLKIGPPVKQEHDTSEKDVVHTFLQRLMMLDYRARYIPVRQDSPEVSQSKPVPVCDGNVLNVIFSTNANSGQSKQTHVHPLDVQMAVFHCSDSFFKQNMITKLSQCQYALPLLVPDPFTMDIECPLWTFSKIIKSWKITQIKDDSTMRSMPICRAETPMVSFFRLGSLSLSKSHLMNTLINDRHSTFFHRNCPGSTKSRHLMDGVAEIAWYCPAGKPNDAFTDCIAFCNLHGDALLTEKQRDILIEKSSVNVVFVPTPDKDDKSTTVISALYNSQKPLIVLIADNDCGAVRMKEGKYKIGLKDRSQSDVSQELKKIIGEVLSGPHASFQLETMSEVSGIKVDENDKVCQKGKSAAKEIVSLLQEMDVSKIKNKFLPCQGKLWHDWCRINKEMYHLKGHIEKEKCKKEQELKQIRQKQCAASCSELMKLFNESFSSLPSTDKQYFLKWTQILIDALSTDDLSSILQSYDRKWSEVLALKNKHDKSDQLKRKQTELDQISTKLQSATFGLEHIFREMGQIYEAHASLQKQRKWGETDWSKYPELAAELMISGHPMELMDGDAGQVPLTWISSLLDEVIKKLGNKRVFVLSVLGVQSSGKSTMLNAMFGLQFAVSAGRCTKGAFMQMVKVSEEIKKDFKFDYILVVDTEGLRALELAGTCHSHDNELATFVVGLGNMTLINIFGENPAEMQDVLQIVVQAFMRMKKVKLSPSCVFVHQNVTDIAAAEKNMDGKRRLQEKLDQMAQLAAKEEVCDAKSFSDVIAFDVRKDVKYFAQLWEGSPPMAPPNPGYSESVQELKNFILSKASKSAGVTLLQFKSKIQDLWKALLNENFIFSFKNTLEIAVYRKLEVQYGNWTWALRSNMLTIENQLHTRIENGKLDKVELCYLHEEMHKTYEEIKESVATYFDDDRDKEMLVQWRGRFENKIKEFHDEQVRGVKRKLDEVIEQKNARKKLDDKKTEFENKLLQKSKELAHQLKDKAKDEEELEKQFNSVWSGWVNELIAGTKPIKDISYEEDQFSILQDLGFESALIAESRSSGRYKDISKIGDYFDYVSLTKHQELCDTSQQSQNDKTENKNIKGQGTSSSWLTWMKKKMFGSTQQNEKHESRNSLSYEEEQLIIALIDDVYQQTIDIIKSKPVATRGYSPTYLQEVAKHVKEKVTEFESKRKYALKKEFTVDLLLYVFHSAGSWLSEAHEKFRMNNDALSYVESKKTQYYNVFRSFCKGSSSAVVLGELICEKLKSSTVEAVCNKTAMGLADDMKCCFPAFSGNRMDLEKHVLKSLAEKEDFDGFITYIRHPRKKVETFIKEEVKKYILRDQRPKALNILKKNVEDINKLVSQALFDATEEVKTQRGDTGMWVEEFSSLLKDELKFNTICCENFSDINNFDFLKEEIEKGLVSIIEEMSSLSLDMMKEFRLKPDQILIDQLCNCCWVKCPFCAAVCTNTLEDHSPDDHSVPFHRSGAVKGWHFRDTVELSVDFCTTNVSSDRSFYPHHDSEESIPYKLYRTAGPKFANWRITPDESKLKYWKWFVCRFEKQLEDYYKLKFQGRGEIPSEWRTHSKEDAIKSLDEIYK